MPVNSYYRATAHKVATRAALRGPRSARVCVVGGGFAGLNTALGLAERGQADVALLDADTIGHGASGRNGGFVFGGFSAGEQALLDRLGATRARALYAGTQDAVNLIRRRIVHDGIACDHTDAGVLWANWFRDPAVLEDRQRLMAEAYGVEWRAVAPEELRELVRSDHYHGALYEPNALHFHPLKYARASRRRRARSPWRGCVRAASRLPLPPAPPIPGRT